MTGDTHSNGETGDRVTPDNSDDFVVEDLLDEADRVPKLGGGAVTSGGGACEHRVDPVGGMADDEVAAPTLSAGVGDAACEPGVDDAAVFADAKEAFATELDAILCDAEDREFDSEPDLECVRGGSLAEGDAPDTFLIDDVDRSWGEMLASQGDDGPSPDRSSTAFDPAALTQRDESGDASVVEAAGALDRAEDGLELLPRSPEIGLGAAAESARHQGGDLTGRGCDGDGLSGADGAQKEDLQLPERAGDHVGSVLEEASGDSSSAVQEDGVQGKSASRASCLRWRFLAPAAVSLAMVIAGLSLLGLGDAGEAGADAAAARVVTVKLRRPRVALVVAEPAEPSAGSDSVVGEEHALIAGVVPPVVDDLRGAIDAPSSGKPAAPAGAEGTHRDADGRTATRGEQGDDVALPKAQSALPPLSRVGQDLLIGDLRPGGVPGAQTTADVLPGDRAFAQLRNGNQFVGRVKRVAADVVTLRVASGEVTLARSDLEVLTPLGSPAFEDLQKATEGAVRLSNHNRISGDILRRPSSDYVVLEGERKRVMLPASAVGEIVRGGGAGSVRLDTSGEEDGWLGGVAARRLGTARGLQPASGAATVRRRGDGK